MKSMGPRTLPWGTPLVTGTQFVLHPLTNTVWFRFDKNSYSQIKFVNACKEIKSLAWSQRDDPIISLDTIQPVKYLQYTIFKPKISDDLLIFPQFEKVKAMHLTMGSYLRWNCKSPRFGFSFVFLPITSLSFLECLEGRQFVNEPNSHFIRS